MHEIIVKTFELIDYLDSSSLIKELEIHKGKIKENNEILTLLDRCHNEENNNKLLQLRQKIYAYPEYYEYMKRYNELSLIIYRINKKYKELTNEKVCDKK